MVLHPRYESRQEIRGTEVEGSTVRLAVLSKSLPGSDMGPISQCLAAGLPVQIKSTVKIKQPDNLDSSDFDSPPF